MKKFTKEALNIAKKEIKIGKTLGEISNLIDFHPDIISKHLRKEGVIINSSNKDLSLNVNYFNNIDTENKAYFLGFITADGCIAKDGNRVHITINSKDDYILDILKKELSSSNIVRKYKVLDKRKNIYHDSSVFQFSNKKIKEDLEKHGVDCNKSFSFIFPLGLPLNLLNHFLRGLLDGDGSISSSRNELFLLSTKEFLEIINNYLFNNLAKISVIQKKKNVYKLNISNKNTCIEFLKYIYTDALIFLERKYKLYNKMKIKNIKTKKESFFSIPSFQDLKNRFL